MTEWLPLVDRKGTTGIPLPDVNASELLAMTSMEPDCQIS